MRVMALAAVLALLAVVPAPAAAAEVTPVQKVLEMLNEMKAKGEREKDEEERTYAVYKEWVDDLTTQLGFDIKTAESEIEELVAFIDKTDNTAAELADAIAQLESEIAGLEADKQEATNVRNREHEEFQVVQQDYSESVDALDRAIQVLQSEAYSRPQAEMLLQKMAVTMPGMRRVLAAFLQEKAKAAEPGAPEVAAYEFQSGGIIAMLEGLYKKFKAELDAVEEEEANKAHANDLQQIHLDDTIAYSKSDKEEKTSTKAKLMAESGAAKGKLADTKVSLAEDQKMLAEVLATFQVKTETFNGNQKVRADEIEALGKAIEIISDPSVAASYATHINLAQVGAPATTLLQLRSSTKRVAAKGRASAYLRRKAAALKSTTLAKLAREMEANPFAKVIKMIEELLAKLKEEAAAEADHKAWCDEQLKKNKLKREKKQSEVDKLTAEIAQLAGQIDTMGKQMATLADEQAALTKAMSEATEIRTKENAENEATIADAKAGQEAVKSALAILKEYYASVALVQVKQVPEMAAYKGQQAGKGGVIGMLEVILSDFERLDADTTAAERTAAAEYESFMAESKADKKAKHDAEFKLSLEKDQAEFEKGELEKDLALVQDELDKAIEYFEYLKPSCLEVHVSYEERVAKRKEEIEALKEAYSILDGDFNIGF